MKILVQRSGALGDVILTTPVIRRLRRENPDAEIYVATSYPDVFRNNLHVNGAASDFSDCDQFISLDFEYEKRPYMHVVESYMLAAFGDYGVPEDRQQEIFYPKDQKLLRGTKYVAVHAAQAGWKNRTLPSSTWVEVCRLLLDTGYQPILVGTERDALPQATAVRFHVPDLHIQTALIASCCCFVGSDTSLLHAAGATDVPIVGVFTSVRPEYRLPWRRGELGWRCKAVVPDLTCVGCQERQAAPSTVERCERGDTICVKSVTAEQIVAAVKALVP